MADYTGEVLNKHAEPLILKFLGAYMMLHKESHSRVRETRDPQHLQYEDAEDLTFTAPQYQFDHLTSWVSLRDQDYHAPILHSTPDPSPFPLTARVTAVTYTMADSRRDFKNKFRQEDPK